MAKNNVILSSSDVSSTDTLYDIYKNMPGNESATLDQFYAFLSTESVDQVLFLEQNCIFSFNEFYPIVVLTVDPK